MEQELLTYALIIMLGGLLSLGLSFYALFRLQDTPGGVYYCLATFLTSMFGFSYLFELLSSTLQSTWFWLRAEYVFLPFIPAVTLLMCCAYIGYRPQRWMRIILFAIPLSTLVMQHTNEWHHLYYTSIALSTDTPFPVTRIEHGPYFYVHSLYLYGCLALSVLLLLNQARRIPVRFRLQIFMMIAGLLTPVIASLFYVSGQSMYGIDLGPVFISVSFVFHSFALFRYRMFDVAPIARDIVFESMADGVLVINENDVVVDYNRAMKQLMHGLTANLIGRRLTDILRSRPDLQQLLDTGKDCDYVYRYENMRYCYRIRFSPVFNKSNIQVGRIIHVSDITEQAELQDQLQYLADMDGLTHLLNKTALMYRAEQELEQLASSGGGHLSILMFDIDEFKLVNDTFGHEAGDVALLYLAEAVREYADECMLAGRYGGDEFILCMPGSDVHTACAMAEKLRRHIASGEICIDREQLRITSSFGVASVYVPSGTRELSTKLLVKQADQALYVSKRAGRNRVQVYGTAEVSAETGSVR
ncbi:histidine kinase N-terminal 7TM domain-containing protein [Paenibacillus sp. SGZ-1009]|uniref:histidine kinase N-terminal 7TM domain-containing diguanylate cyclase n=1 Tax=Paenibacillus campi TaxID=3106031 RepID=UPI002AFDFC91|nr:histidine kinase N-terminal 7TM domain-containing protein [Paenibacillus sp. SGZ-1009]